RSRARNHRSREGDFNQFLLASGESRAGRQSQSDAESPGAGLALVQKQRSTRSIRKNRAYVRQTRRAEVQAEAQRVLSPVGSQQHRNRGRSAGGDASFEYLQRSRPWIHRQRRIAADN